MPSADHRGTPESNGRVVTVIERSFWETLSDPATKPAYPRPTQHQDVQPNSNESLVWGAAYHIPASHAEEVNAYLDHREINGYSVHYTPFHPYTPSTQEGEPDAPDPSNSSPPFLCMVYIGLPTNSQFLRNPTDRDPSSVAGVIAKSRGQSGENKEYLYLLEKALEGIGLGYADAHVTDLVRRVRALEGVREGRKSQSEIDVEKITIPEAEYREDEAMEEVDEHVERKA
ncbi:ChaC-like protein [Coccidioides posadasii C735 delta SOWgp]|uniref:glutathione-specific gamma-glutamylcyclotransferase n=1 Tax=Coccidioides posadasii (strain C735) TaxID=222929 RepID=C5PB69_COCP7|nr:ChaC-like protein [Coccidioides posadasii C735 delta SOWgp]EER25853.1 ChaC-like protein [Coccidioides posadasii C735 delta SOWgp]|eukprot:XP_003067998.1 ChaC-like protein [Coccidioides posadasii C735 delta SOWgp]